MLDQHVSKKSIDFVELEELPIKTLKRKREQADLGVDFNPNYEYDNDRVSAISSKTCKPVRSPPIMSPKQ